MGEWGAERRAKIKKVPNGYSAKERPKMADGRWVVSASARSKIRNSRPK